MEPKPPRESVTTLAQVMLIDDANPWGNVHGGTIMKLVDTAAAMAAHRHSRRRMSTVALDGMRFTHPIHVGNLVAATARVTAVWRTSLEAIVTVEAEDVLTGDRRECASAYLVFVALDDTGRPTEIPPLLLETDAERALALDAEERRRLRLETRHK
jgi:acyl-CoA hydrolase